MEPVLVEKLIGVVSRHHRLARQTTIRVAQLKDEPFVFFPKFAGPTAWQRTMTLCEEHGFQAKIVQEAPHWVTILSLVDAGLGVTIAPECIRRIAAKSIACRPLSGHGATHIELARRKGESSPVAREFCRLARTRFRDRAR